MKSISVVTVTFNNAVGLRQTLASLAALTCGPQEIVIVDGGSSDDTVAVVREFEQRLPVAFASEPDAGIYDAMNKGRARCRGELVHYLNAGDIVFGEPYRAVDGPCLLPVNIHDESGQFFFSDFVRHGGFAYCHQGILFPRDHPSYDLTYRVAADLDVMIACFPHGLRALPRAPSGGVRFDAGGVSSQSRGMQDREFRAIFHRRLPWWTATRLCAAIAFKNVLPRTWRRTLVRLWRGGSSSARAA